MPDSRLLSAPRGGPFNARRSQARAGRLDKSEPKLYDLLPVELCNNRRISWLSKVLWNNTASIELTAHLISKTANVAERAVSLTMENTVKHLPLSTAGALLLAGSMSTYSLAQQQLKEPNAAVEQGQGANQGSRQEKPQPKDGKDNAAPSAGEKAQNNPDGPDGDKTKNTQREEPSGKAVGKPSEDAGKQPGRDQAGSGGAGAGSQAKEAEKQGGNDGKGKQQRHAGKKLEPKQRTVVKETIVKRNVRPVQVNFSINVGSAIPRSVVLYDLPPVLIEYEPSYSRYKFIMTDDDTILVIDPETWTIIDIIEV